MYVPDVIGRALRKKGDTFVSMSSSSKEDKCLSVPVLGAGQGSVSFDRLAEVVDILPDPVFAIDSSGVVVVWNQAMEDLTNVRAGEILGKGNYEHALAFYGYRRPMLVDYVMSPSLDIEGAYETLVRKPDGSVVGQAYCPVLGLYVWGRAKALYDPFGNIKGAVATIRDITDMKRTQDELNYRKECVEALFKNSGDAIAFVDREGRVLEINDRFTELFGYTLDEIRGKNIDELLTDRTSYSSARLLTETVLKDSRVATESFRYTKMGASIEVSIKGVPVVVGGRVVGGYGIYSDISSRRRYEDQLRYLSTHDALTGLYNRAFFEEEMKRLSTEKIRPVTFISIDVDGLKLVNDTMGHEKGNELLKASAEVLKKALRSTDVLVRMGGDEFVAILPYADARTGEEILKKMRCCVEEYNRARPELPLSVSIGVATCENDQASLEQCYRRSDDLMYRDKLLRARSLRSQIVNALLSALVERDFVMKGHTERVEKLSTRVGEKLGLTSRQLGDLALLSQVHDLGKVGIPDRILFKPGPLTLEEQEIMTTHCEKGYRIALSSHDLAPIAHLILKHHERWDGKGYPLGLRGTEIPVECRILAIVDAYDAMTSDRPYRKAMTVEEALNEIRSGSGSQFDPELVNLFLEIVQVQPAGTVADTCRGD